MELIDNNIKKLDRGEGLVAGRRRPGTRRGKLEKIIKTRKPRRVRAWFGRTTKPVKRRRGTAVAKDSLGIRSISGLSGKDVLKKRERTR